MGMGAQTWRTPSSQTEPSGAPAFLGSALGTELRPNVPVSTCFAPDIYGVVMGSGTGQPYHIWRGGIYATGILPPSAAPGVDSAGAKATRTLVGNATPTIHNGDSLLLTDSAGTLTINFVTTLTKGASYEVVAPSPSGTSDSTIMGYIALLMSTAGTNGYLFWDPGGVGGILGNTDIRATSVSSFTLNLEAQTAGIIGNGYSTGWTSGTAPDPAVGAFTGGTTTVGSIPAGYHYWAYAYARGLEGGFSGMSPVVGVTLGAQSGMPLIDLTASEDGTIDRAVIFRSTREASRLYRVDEQDDGTSTYTDILPDTSIVAYGALYYNERLFRSRHAGFPTNHSQYAFHNGAVWGGGVRRAASYAIGSCSVQGPNHASGATDQVVLATGLPTQDFIGRTFYASGVPHYEPYTIIGVVESSATLTLSRPFGGLTAPSATYEIRDDRDANALDYSVVGRVNQWPANQNLEGVTSDDGQGITGLVSKWERLNVFTSSSIWWVRGNSPTTYQIRKAVSGVGAVSGRSIVSDGDALYWLGVNGIYGWGGSGQPTRISNPKATSGGVRGIQGTIDRINLSALNWCHAVLDPEERVAIFFVPLDNDIVPRHAIVLDLSTLTFSLETVPDITASAVLTRSNGDRVVVYGDIQGNLWETNTGTTDGAYGFVPLQTLSGAQTTKKLTVSGTALPTSGNGLKGVPVVLKDASGDWELREVASNTSSVITLTRDTSLTMAALDQIMVGGIPLFAQTGDFDLGISDTDKILSNLYFTTVYASAGEYFVGVGSETGSQAAPTLDASNKGDLTRATGVTKFRAGKRGRTHQFSIFTADVGMQPKFRRFAMDIRARDQMRVGGE